MSRIRTIEEETVRTSRIHDRRERAFRRARRHSRRVRILKIALPTAAVVVVAAFIVATRFNPVNDLSVGMSGVAVSNGKIVMENPKLEGINRENLPYRMIADRAIQDGLTGGPVRLEGVDARLPFDANNFAQIDADSAIYDRENNTLVFDSAVTVTTTDGMSARLATARVDIEKGDLSTDDAVVIRLEGADIEANAMRVRENGKVFIFTDKVRMNIAPRQTQAAQDGSGGRNGG